MKHLQAVYYRARDGSEPVHEVVEKLSVKRQVALDNQIGRMNLLTPANPHLPHPYSSQIDGELRELRCHYGNQLYRILYRCSRNLLVLLHAIAKNGKEIPEADKESARRRWEDYTERMNEAPRRRPRAVGRDVPS